MLNDVHFPPSSDDSKPHPSPARARSHHNRGPTGNADSNTKRVLDRLPNSTRSDVPEAIYGEPEDRGDAFNTELSTLIVGGVTVLVVVLAALMFLR